MPYYNRDPKRDHNFDNHPYGSFRELGIPLKGSFEGSLKGSIKGLGFRVSENYGCLIAGWGAHQQQNIVA